MAGPVLEDPDPGGLGRRASFAWVDDEITDADRDWATANHRGRALLYHVEPFRGLSSKDFTALDQWLRAA